MNIRPIDGQKEMVQIAITYALWKDAADYSSSYNISLTAGAVVNALDANEESSEITLAQWGFTMIEAPDTTRPTIISSSLFPPNDVSSSTPVAYPLCKERLFLYAFE